MNKKTLQCELCIIGGGLSGCFAAIEAARGGAKVILMQDRPVLGGNASSEVRMWVRGAGGKYHRETGLVSQLEERNIYYNPTLCHSLFDATLYAMVNEWDNITLLMNTSCLDAKTEGGKILSVTGWQLTTYTFLEVEAKLFMDCSGDSILADLVGAQYRHGRESKEEFGEELAQEQEDSHTMGMSVLLAARETDHPVKFTPPPFANVYPDDSCFAAEVGENVHAQIRDHKIGTSGANLWWVELGGEVNSIFDADKTRQELLACIYGVWDHLKNQEDHGLENWDLEWVGALPGKRESRRYVGDYVLTEHDIRSGGHFEDEIAYGAWPMDDHNPYGMRKTEGACLPSVMIPVNAPYGIPLRCLYSKNVENLMFAGRNISVSHVALSSTRVMGTCSLLGQAAGCAAALALKLGLSPRETAQGHTSKIQQTLLDHGVYLPHVLRKVSPLMQEAKLNLSQEDREVLLNAWERPTKAAENFIRQEVGSRLCMEWEEEKQVASLRLCFDPDFSRKSISENAKMRVYAMKLHTGKDFTPVRIPRTLVKEFTVLADGEEIRKISTNFSRLVEIPVNQKVKKLEIFWQGTHGASTVHLFSAEAKGPCD